MSPGWRGIFQSGSSVLEGSDNGKGGGFLNFFPLDMMKLSAKEYCIRSCLFRTEVTDSQSAS